MKPPENENELEDLLARPCAADVAYMRELEGDLLILGAGGKMGPSLACRARRAVDEAGVRKRIIAVARFSQPSLRALLESNGVEALTADLLEPDQLDRLPDCQNVVFMAARKFGTTGNEHLTWAANTILPARVAERFRRSRIVAFSTGNVYPLMPREGGGAAESTPTAPVGEYAQSALGRERVFEYFSARHGTCMTLLRLNYAIDLRYGVLLDIGRRVFDRKPIDLSMGRVNVIWQGDANSVCLRSFALCQSPPFILNLTGPEILDVRSIARRFADLFGVAVRFAGDEGDSDLISDASLCLRTFGAPQVGVDLMLEWTADWILRGGRVLDKPTHFQVRNGSF